MRTKALLAIIAAVLWTAMPQQARATAQIPDILIVGNDTLSLFCNPLDEYFDEAHPRPNDMWGMGSTACWRGYQAYFEIRSDSLFLKGIRLGRKGDSTDFYPLAKLFGDKATPTGVFAYWVNKPLSCVDGDLLHYVHMGYGSLYEFEIEYIMRKGIVRKRKVYDNSKAFIPIEYDFCLMEENYSLLINYIELQIDYSRLDPEDLDYYTTVEIQRVDSKGGIRKVKTDAKSPKQKRAIRRALKKVPRFMVLYSGGKPIKNPDWIFFIRIYASKEEQAKLNPATGPDIGSWTKEKMLEEDNYVFFLRFLAENYKETYHVVKAIIGDTSATGRKYKDYFCSLYGDSLLYQHHYFMTLGDSALKYYYQYWDETDDHQKLYPTIVRLEQELGRAHNPKIVESENPPFKYLVFPEDMDWLHQADSESVCRRCRQVSYSLRGFGEGDLHEPLPKGIQEEWRFLLLRGDYFNDKSPVLVKVVHDGKEARIIWRVAKEENYDTYPGLDHFRHGIRSQGERLLTDEEWNRLQYLANEAGFDTLYLDNDYFNSPPASYNIEHRTRDGYCLVNDYNHPYYSDEINPLFWPFRAFCKYLLTLADPTLPFDSDDEH